MALLNDLLVAEPSYLSYPYKELAESGFIVRYSQVHSSLL